MKKEILRKSGKISVYQVLPRLFDNKNSTKKPHGTLEENGCGKLVNFNRDALKAIRDLGCTHVWYTGVLEHATKSSFEGIPSDHPATVKGEAGSPYAIKDYYDIAPSLATMVPHRLLEFDDLVTRSHEAGLGVIIDFVPNHVARQYHSDSHPRHVQDLGAQDDVSKHFDPNNNFYYLPNETVRLDFDQTNEEPYHYYEHPAMATGNDLFSAHPTRNDWYETVKLNYGVDYLAGRREYFDPIPNTWQKMLEILTFWAARGVDGFRCDMAEMVPVAFWRWATEQMKRSFPDLIFIGEVYQPGLYVTFSEAGFDYLYNKVGLYDYLIEVLKGRQSARNLTHVWQAQDPRLQGRMLNFMENHDEQRLASDYIAGSGRRAFPAMAVSALVSNDGILTYFGQELGERGMESEGFSGQDGRTTIFDYWSLDSIQAWSGEDSKFRGDGLDDEQRSLRNLYERLLNAAIHRRSFSEGGFHDLMYANPQLPDDTYAFLRAAEGEVSLVVANFSNDERTMEVTLPKHAFESLHIPSGQVWQMEELLTGGESVAALSEDEGLCLTIPAWCAGVFYFTRVRN